MCVIIYKPACVAAPSETIIKNCFAANPDGAGVAIHRQGAPEVEISKGFMDVDSFLAYVSSAIDTEDTAIYHFRIGTSGGNTPGNCHPFPVSDNVHCLKALSIKSRFVFAHNGIIGQGEADLSDTQLYIKDTLSRLDLCGFAPALQERIARETDGSRTILIDGQTGAIMLTGNWIIENGLYFSNASYLTPYSGSYYWPLDEEDETYLNALYYDDDVLPCPECSRYGYCICPDWGLFQCEHCRAVYDSSGEVLFSHNADCSNTREVY